MRAGEDPQTDPNDTQNKEQSQNAAPAEDSLLELAAAIVTLARQTWQDRLALAKAELRLAYNSVLLVIGLAFFLSMTVMLIWILLLAGISYLGLLAGIAWGWVLLVMLIAHLGLAFYLRQQIISLTRMITFPETRRAFARIPKGTEEAPTTAPHEPAAAGEATP